MMSTAKRVMKGVWNKTKRKQPKSNFAGLSWIQEKIIKHQDDVTIKKITLNGCTISYQRPYELLHTYNDIFEKEIYRFKSGSTQPVIIDCGSNIGLSIIYYKQLYPKSIVYAFEPDEKNFFFLNENVKSNGSEGVTLSPSAVWTVDGFVQFSDTGSEASHIHALGTGQKVPSIRLQSFLKGFDEIDFLKIDIEGAEWEVMMDCASELKRIKHLFLEYHGRSNQTSRLNDLLELMDSAGFEVYVKIASDQLAHPFIQKQTASLYDVQLNIFCYRN